MVAFSSSRFSLTTEVLLKAGTRRNGAPHGDSPTTRFWNSVQKNGADECWLWVGPIRRNYGTVDVRHAAGPRGKCHHGAHRISWVLHNGLIPDGKFICHSCDTPLCVNPSHLFLGDHRENMVDMASKNRADERRGSKNTSAKLNESQARLIRAAPGKLREIAKQYGVSIGTVSLIKIGKTWTHA